MLKCSLLILLRISFKNDTVRFSTIIISGLFHRISQTNLERIQTKRLVYEGCGEQSTNNSGF